SRWTGDQPTRVQSFAGALAPRNHTVPGPDSHGRNARSHPDPDADPDPHGGALEGTPRHSVPQPVHDAARR
ncbi:MAG TPA: hypothetical protein VJ010_07985, partial [Actinomycetota bacterium]|nr:hypothetical protein [Actinomycetota bacterium]